MIATFSWAFLCGDLTSFPDAVRPHLSLLLQSVEVDGWMDGCDGGEASQTPTRLIACRKTCPVVGLHHLQWWRWLWIIKELQPKDTNMETSSNPSVWLRISRCLVIAGYYTCTVYKSGSWGGFSVMQHPGPLSPRDTRGSVFIIERDFLFGARGLASLKIGKRGDRHREREREGERGGRGRTGVESRSCPIICNTGCKPQTALYLLSVKSGGNLWARKRKKMFPQLEGRDNVKKKAAHASTQQIIWHQFSGGWVGGGGGTTEDMVSQQSLASNIWNIQSIYRTACGWMWMNSEQREVDCLVLVFVSVGLRKLGVLWGI